MLAQASLGSVEWPTVGIVAVFWYSHAMFEHLTTLDPDDFTDLTDVDSRTLLNASARSADLLSQLQGEPEEEGLTPAQLDEARRTFAALADPGKAEATRKAAVLALRVPQAVRKVSEMLSAYDWEFVNQAKEIRGYIVKSLLDETQSPDPKIRLKALQMLGNVTEVGAFTERIEITKKDASAEELTDRIRAKLAALLPKTIEVQDVSPKEV